MPLPPLRDIACAVHTLFHTSHGAMKWCREDGILPTPAHSRCFSSQLAGMICSTSPGDDFNSAKLPLEQFLLAVRLDVLLSPHYIASRKWRFGAEN